jgi:2-succinyl-5-enolpyruvyl-6-hydroxy-3-cyclohexene-1-carboxylate synthase
VSANEHLAWSRLVVGSLVAAGVRHAVVSPGSRSTPLALAALALSEAGALALDVVVDERTAAFLSLGRARATGEPSLLVCTSGTAAAHYLPALIEAEQAGVPLVVLTADRPFEAAHAGSAQTIEQTRLFGVYARRFVELGAPDGGALAGMPRLVSAAVHEALRAPAGPVHLNARFRKPLEPQGDGASPLDAEVARLLERGPPRRARATRLPSDAELDRLAAQLSQAERPLLVAGPQPAWAGHAQAAHTLARTLGAPLLAEATSQLRFGDPRGAIVVGHFSSLLRARRLARELAPDLVLELGRTPTSAAYAELVAGLEAPRVVLTDDGRADPEGNAALVLEADLAATLEALARRLGAPRPASRYAERWAALDRAVRTLCDALAGDDGLGEASTARAVVRALGRVGGRLVLGNSLPVRELDAWCSPSPEAVEIVSQRGASGIDGLVAQAVGVASLGRPTALLVGDVSFLHDAGSLALLDATRAHLPLALVVIDNGGGRIFERLPVASRVPEASFERLFVTARALDREALARAYGLAFARPTCPVELEVALARALTSGPPTLLEVKVEPHDGASRARRLERAMEESVR